MLKVLLIIVLSFTSQGCLYSDLYRYKVVSSYDKFNKMTFYKMMNNLLSMTEGRILGGVIYLDATKSVWDSGEIHYGFSVKYEGPDWLFIEPGESLIFLIDGEKVILKSKDGSEGAREIREKPYVGTIVQEIAHFHGGDPDLLRKIANAKQVDVRVMGKHYLDRHFTEENFANFKSFVAEHVDKEG